MDEDVDPILQGAQVLTRLTYNFKQMGAKVPQIIWAFSQKGSQTPIHKKGWHLGRCQFWSRFGKTTSGNQPTSIYNSKQNEPSKTNPTSAFFVPFHAQFPVFWSILALYWEKHQSSDPCVRAIPLQESFLLDLVVSKIVCWMKVVSFADNSTQFLHLKRGKTHARSLPTSPRSEPPAQRRRTSDDMNIMWTQHPNAANFDWDLDLSLKKRLLLKSWVFDLI